MSDYLGGDRAQLTVAIVGAGPAGFYSAEALLKQGARVDLFEQLPAPHGLVRYGVAPDHQKIKTSARAFEKTAEHEAFRFFGNVDVGRDVQISELCSAYDQVLITVGSADDRRMDIRGEDLLGSVSSTSFVGWYNGHPHHRDFSPPLDGTRAVIVGMGNVAMDVARILMRHPCELEPTDIAAHALEALSQSQIREVMLLGRRGPAQAAFDLSELRELGELLGVQVGIHDPYGDLKRFDGKDRLDETSFRKLEYVLHLPRAEELTAPRRVLLRFFASPAELIGDEDGVVGAVRVERNHLAGEGARAEARGTGSFEDIPAGLVIRAIGYRGRSLPGVPFDERTGTIPNIEGRVLDTHGRLIPKLYVAGWIKRGPTGLIGTNKQCAKETVANMLEDACERPPPSARTVRSADRGIDKLLELRAVRVVTRDDWQKIDAVERLAGEVAGRVRAKLTTTMEMLAVLDDYEEGSAQTPSVASSF
jgi:ferredoxin--NADP+ reductase